MAQDGASTEYVIDTVLKYLTPMQVACTLDYELDEVCRKIDALALNTGTRIVCGRVIGEDPDAVRKTEELVAHRTTLRKTANALHRQIRERNGKD